MAEQISAEELILVYILERLWRPGRALVRASITWREGRIEQTQHLDAEALFAWWEGTRYTVCEQTEKPNDSTAEQPGQDRPNAPAGPRDLTNLEQRIMNAFDGATRFMKADGIGRKLGKERSWPYLRTVLKRLKVDGFLVEDTDGRGYWPAGQPLPSNAA